MEPETKREAKGADVAPQTVSGWFIGTIAGYRLTVVWMGLRLLEGAFALYLLWYLANEVRLVRLLLEAK